MLAAISPSFRFFKSDFGIMPSVRHKTSSTSLRLKACVQTEFPWHCHGLAPFQSTDGLRGLWVQHGVLLLPHVLESISEFLAAEHLFERTAREVAFFAAAEFGGGIFGTLLDFLAFLGREVERGDESCNVVSMEHDQISSVGWSAGLYNKHRLCASPR